MTNWDNIVRDKELAKVAKTRRVDFYEQKGYTSALSDMESDGWIATSTYANPKYTKYRKTKPFYEQFEDSVWYMFYRMGFTDMNRDRQFRMTSDAHNPALTQQIDVFAVEEETVFVVECKSCDKPKEVTYKKELEALHSQMSTLRGEIATRYPNRKVIFVWATQNAIVGEKDKERMKEWGIRHFDDAVIGYYLQLAEHLGTSARYQLLGNILSGIEIKNMDMDVPAIEGKMGGTTYYSFSIEPSKLLKIGYVLHRSKANSDMMPTYQRVIKKSRLQEIRKFVNNGGFFPNSIIVSIDTRGRSIQFDPAGPRKDGHSTRVGILHLPKKYHTAYIIDGQHRLYGYSDSEYAYRDCVPVIAFIDLPRQDQLQMFMDINENQKAVAKKLRVTLVKDLYWDAEDLGARRIALRSKIAGSLGDDSSSPLFQRVDMEEDTPVDVLRCISVEDIQKALEQSHYFNTYGKNNTLKESGTFDFSDLDKTFNTFFKFLCGCLRFIMNSCPSEWDKGRNGVLTMNRGMYACIRVIDDIVNLLVSQNKIKPLTDSVDSIVNEVCFYLQPLTEYINGITPEQASEIKSKVGSGGKPRFYRYFQKPIADAFSDFNPEGLEEFFENQTRKYNEVSRNYLIEIEAKLRVIVRDALVDAYGQNWKKDGIKKDILLRIHNDAYEKNLDADPGVQIDEWDLLTFDDILGIATYGHNWSQIFDKVLVRPDAPSGGRKEDKLAWLNILHKELGRLSSTSVYSINKATYEDIRYIHGWLCE